MRAFLCPWMDGMQQGAKDGGAAMPWMDGMQQGAKDGGSSMNRKYGILQIASKAAVAGYFISRNEFH